MFPLDSLGAFRLLALLDKVIETDEQDGYDYFSYSITDLGVDTLLKNEDSIQPKRPEPVDDFDEEIPF